MILNVRYRTLKNGRTHRLSERQTRLLLLLADGSNHRYTELQKFLGTKDTRSVKSVKYNLCNKIPELKIYSNYQQCYRVLNKILITY